MALLVLSPLAVFPDQLHGKLRLGDLALSTFTDSRSLLYGHLLQQQTPKHRCFPLLWGTSGKHQNTKREICFKWRDTFPSAIIPMFSQGCIRLHSPSYLFPQLLCTHSRRTPQTCELPCYHPPQKVPMKSSPNLGTRQHNPNSHTASYSWQQSGDTKGDSECKRGDGEDLEESWQGCAVLERDTFGVKMVFLCFLSCSEHLHRHPVPTGVTELVRVKRL